MGIQNMARFHFIECLVRIGYQKYDGFRRRDLVESMNGMFSEQIEPWLEYEQTKVWGSTDWRRNALFTEEVHKVLDMNMELLRALHK